MRIIKTIIPLLFAIIMLMMAGDVSAQGAGATSASDPASALSRDMIKNALIVDNMSDYSKAHYTAIFGCPAGFFAETCQPTVLGIVVGGFNTIALIMGAVVLGYIIIGGAINTAASGEILGKSWSSTWLPIRTAAAFGLILPVASIAPYSPAQMATLYAVAIGDNMATAWVKEVADRVGAREAGLASQPPISSPYVAIELAGSVFCAANEWNILTRYGTSRVDKVNIYSVYTGSGGWNSREKITTSEMPAVYKSRLGSPVYAIDFGHTGACGSMKLPKPPSMRGLASTTEDTDSANKERAFVAANALVLSYLNKYSQIEHQFRTAGITDKAIEAILSADPLAPEDDATAMALATDFANTAKAFPKELLDASMNGFGSRDSNTFIGREIMHYTDINKLLHKMAEFAAAPIEAMHEINLTLKNDKWNACLTMADDCKKTLSNSALKELNKGIRIETTMRAIYLLEEALNDGRDTPGNVGTNYSESATFDGKGDTSDFVSDFVGWLKMKILGAFSNYVDTGDDRTSANQHMNFSLNPLIMFHNISSVLVTAAGILATTFAIVGGAAHAAAGSIITNTFGAGGAVGFFEVLFAIVMPIFWALVMLSAMFLTISTVPIIVGIWGYISIILMAIQGVSAAPFAVVLLASPEGAGATNQTFQRFLLHWTHLALAPMIFVLGAVASLSMMVVGSNIVIWVFLKDMNFFGSDSWIIIIASLFIFCGLLGNLVYKTSMYQITLQNDIMEIIGGGFHKPMGDNSAESTKGGGAASMSAIGALNKKGGERKSKQDAAKAKDSKDAGGGDE